MNLSIEEAVQISKKYLRQMAQPFTLVSFAESFLQYKDLLLPNCCPNETFRIIFVIFSRTCFS